MDAHNAGPGRQLAIALALCGALAVSLASFTFRATPDSPARAEGAPPDAPKATGAARRPAAITVVTCYEGMPPEVVEASITDRVERWLGQLPGVASCESRSVAGVSIVRVTLRPDTDLAVALGGANSLALAALPHLPPGCLPPLVLAGDPARSRVVGLVAVQSATLDEARLAEVARNTVRPTLDRVPGVQAPAVLGGKDRQVGIFLDPRKMQARGLTATDVLRSLDGANTATGARFGDAELSFDFKPAIGSLEEFGDVPIRIEAGRTIYLRDVALPKETAAQTSLVRFDGKRAVCVPLFASGTAADLEIQKAVTRLEKELPEGTRLNLLSCGGADDGAAEITVHLRTPPGSSLDATEKRVAEVERLIEGAIPTGEREWVVSEVGLRADASAIYTQHAGPQDATIRIRLGGKRSRTGAEYALKLRELSRKEKAFADVTARFRVGPVAFGAIGHHADLALRVRGGTAEGRAEVADRVRRRIAAIDGVTAVLAAQRTDAPRFKIDLDRAKAAALGLSAAEVFRQVADALGSGSAQGWIDPKTGESFRVVVRSPSGEYALDQLRDTPLKVGGKSVPLSAVARIEKQTAPVELTRLDGRPVLDLLIDTGGKKLDVVAVEVEKAIRDEKQPAGVSLELYRLFEGVAH